VSTIKAPRLSTRRPSTCWLYKISVSRCAADLTLDSVVQSHVIRVHIPARAAKPGLQPLKILAELTNVLVSSVPLQCQGYCVIYYAALYIQCRVNFHECDLPVVPVCKQAIPGLQTCHTRTETPGEVPHFFRTRLGLQSMTSRHFTMFDIRRWPGDV
jgi:hypothetical protein